MADQIDVLGSDVSAGEASDTVSESQIIELVLSGAKEEYSHLVDAYRDQM